jgi:hypothetical protein
MEDVNNEDIVDALGALGSDDAIASLKIAYAWRPEWDEYSGLAEKCLVALAELGSPAAKGVLKEVADSEEGELSWLALTLLGR